MNNDSAIKILTVAVVLSFVCTAGVAVWLNGQNESKDTETVFRLYVGLSNDSGEMSYDEGSVIASRIIMSYGDGLTISKATGAWKNDDGTIDYETSMVIDLAGYDIGTVHKICDELKKELRQNSIMIVTFEQTVEFY